MVVDEAHVRDLVSPYVGATGGLITALRSIQGAYRCIPNDVDAIVADVFNLTRAEVLGVISFYADFSREQKGETVVRICAAEACQAVGGRALQKDVEKRLGLSAGETCQTRDLTVEKVFCLGLCSAAPAAMVGDQLIGAASVDRICDRLPQSEK